MDASLTAALGLGFMLGLRHAMEADHIAAMSTFVSRERSLVRSCLRGTFWGIGHTAALLAAGVAIIAFKLRIPPEVERVVEPCIALVLILLGGHVLLLVVGSLSWHRHEHVHGGSPHSHLHVHVGGADSQPSTGLWLSPMPAPLRGSPRCEFQSSGRPERVRSWPNSSSAPESVTSPWSIPTS